MEKFSEIMTLLVSTLGVMAVIMPFVIEFIKNLVTEEKILKIFGTLERFCALVSAIIAVIIYVTLIILIPEAFTAANIVQRIVIGIFFTCGCAIASQIGYDKIIKWIVNK